MNKYKIMHFSIFLFCLSFILFAGGITSFAEMYKWVDENGVAHFSDQPPIEEDESEVEVLQTVKPSNNDIVRIREKTDSKNNSGEVIPPKYEIPDRKLRTAKVELYVTSWCKWCKRSKAFFRSQGVRFKEYDVEKDKAAGRRKQKLSKGKGVPFAMVNGVPISGYDERAYVRALNKGLGKK